MANIMRVRAQLTGPPVAGPSVGTFYFDAGVTGGPAALWTFWKDLEGLLPSSLTIQVDATGDILNDANGNLVGTWSESSGAPIVGTAANSWIEGVGMRVVWNTGGIVFGRRVRGSTFVVPLASTKFQVADGTIDNATISGGTTVAQALIDSDTGFLIWSRPHKGASDGDSSPVTGVTIPDRVSWLRSRRT